MSDAKKGDAKTAVPVCLLLQADVVGIHAWLTTTSAVSTIVDQAVAAQRRIHVLETVPIGGFLDGPMQIRLLTPQALREYAGDDIRLEIEQNTVADLLAELQRHHPKLYGCICDETGRLRQHINLFVGNELLARNHFSAELRPGDVVSVFTAVSGG